jgi:hypothetical protein
MIENKEEKKEENEAELADTEGKVQKTAKVSAQRVDTGK